MWKIGAFEAKNTLGALLDRVERGEEVIITRHGKAIARLVPNTDHVNHADVAAAMARISARARTLSGDSVRWDVLQADRDAGRP